MKKILMALVICLAVFALFSCKVEPDRNFVTFKLTKDSYELLCDYWVDEWEADPSLFPTYEEFLEEEYEGLKISTITVLFYEDGEMVISGNGQVIETYEYSIDDDNCLIVDGYWIGDVSDDGQFLLLGEEIILQKV